MSEYRIYLNEELLCKTDWLPRAQAAWDRASRDRDGAQHGGLAVLLKDGVEVAAVRPRTGEGWSWPDRATPLVGPRDVAAAVQQLARLAGVSAADLAEQMTTQGLPTNPARLKSITTLQLGRSASVSCAEVVSMCYAAIAAIKSNDSSVSS